jgi:hypothetical protein
MARAGGENMNEPRPESMLRLNAIGMGVSRAAVSIGSLSPIGDTSYFPRFASSAAPYGQAGQIVATEQCCSGGFAYTDPLRGAYDFPFGFD